MELGGTAAYVLAGCLVLLALGAVSLINLVRMVGSAKPTARRQRSWYPALVIVRTDLLTDAGLRYRRRFILSLAGFFAFAFAFLELGARWFGPDR